jgi:transposase-like protein
MKNRGREDILIAGTDGLTGFPEAIRAVYPPAPVQLCIVPLVRHSTKFVSYKDLKGLCADLKKGYAAATEQAGRDALDEFAQKGDSK